MKTMTMGLVTLMALAMTLPARATDTDWPARYDTLREQALAKFRPPSGLVSIPTVSGRTIIGKVIDIGTVDIELEKAGTGRLPEPLKVKRDDLSDETRCKFFADDFAKQQARAKVFAEMKRAGSTPSAMAELDKHIDAALPSAPINRDAMTIDDLKSSWRDLIGKTVRVHIARRSDINQLSDNEWESNLWHKGANLYCTFDRSMLDQVKSVWTDNRDDVAGFYLVGTIREATVTNPFNKTTKAPGLVITAREK